MQKSKISLTKTGAFGPTGILTNSIGTSVQLRQTVTGDELVVGGNSRNGSLGEFTASRTLAGLESIRTMLMPVAPGTTAEALEAYLAQYPDACLYKVRSMNVMDILGDNQLAALNKGTRSIADYEASHTVVNPTTGEAMPGFTATYFSLEAQADTDSRTAAQKAAAGSVAAPVVVDDTVPTL